MKATFEVGEWVNVAVGGGFAAASVVESLPGAYKVRLWREGGGDLATVSSSRVSASKLRKAVSS